MSGSTRMRDIGQVLLLVWVAVCTTLAAHFRARLVEELEARSDAKRFGSPGDHPKLREKYYRRFVMTVVVGLTVLAVSLLLLFGNQLDEREVVPAAQTGSTRQVRP